MERLLLGEVGGGERLFVRLGDDGRPVVLVGLPEHYLDLMEREVLLAENFHVLFVKAGFPSLVVTLLDPLPVRVRHPVALVPEGLRLFLELPAGGEGRS